MTSRAGLAAIVVAVMVGAGIGAYYRTCWPGATPRPRQRIRLTQSPSSERRSENLTSRYTILKFQVDELLNGMPGVSLSPEATYRRLFAVESEVSQICAHKNQVVTSIFQSSTQLSEATRLVKLACRNMARAVARGQAPPTALHPRVATVAIVLLRNEFVVRGVPAAPDRVLVEIVDQVYLPLIRGHQPTIP